MDQVAEADFIKRNAERREPLGKYSRGRNQSGRSLIKFAGIKPLMLVASLQY
jgi:hypothetical protein